MNSRIFRSNPLLLRNEYPVTELGMPILAPHDLSNITAMLSYHDIRADDATAKQENILVHFFKNDDRFDYLFQNAYGQRASSKMNVLAQYTAVCTPDYSLYPEMPYPEQVHQVFKSRWCGAHWQAMGLNVVPTVSWADKQSFAFCFDGIPYHSTVVVSTVGCNYSKTHFLTGYNRMLDVLQPKTVICYGTPFSEMEGNIICYPYSAFRKQVIA